MQQNTIYIELCVDMTRCKTALASRKGRELEAAPVSLIDGVPEAYLAVRNEAKSYFLEVRAPKKGTS